MPVVGELIYTPFITLATVLISLIAISLVLSKRTGTGLVGGFGNEVALVYQLSTSSSSGNIALDSTWTNRVVYISCDKANLSPHFNIVLFDPSSIPDGSSITVFNSPASSWPTRLTIQWTGTPSKFSATTPQINISLGTGQGVTLITQRRIGSYSVTNLGGTDFIPPDLTPGPLQPRDWTVYQYFLPQLNMCSAINGVTSSSYSAITDENPLSPCYNLVNGSFSPFPNTGIGLGLINGGVCTSFICQCPPGTFAGTPIYPPPGSAWCNL